MSDDKTSVAAKVDPEVKHRFRVKVAVDDTTMSERIAEFIEQEVEGVEIPS